VVRADLLLAALFLLLVFATQITLSDSVLTPLDYALLVLVAAPVALRQVAPVVTFFVMLVAAAAYLMLGNMDQDNNWLGVAVGMYTVATVRRLTTTGMVFLTGTAVVFASGLVVFAETSWAEFAQEVVILFIAVVLGVGAKRQRERTEYLAQESARAVVRERVNIARELHDIVTHHMSVVSLHAGLAERVIYSDTSAARAALGTIGNSSREALKELRRLLDVLRVDDKSDDKSADRPQAGLSSLTELVENARGAGIPVTMQVTGEPRALPDGLDLAVFRIMQESLTNVLKHAGEASATVELSYGSHLLTLVVTNEAAAEPPFSTGSHGIRGMRERIALYNGTLLARPLEAGGFQVILCMPISESVL
jgi:signal transduction histidine kinase